ncbi:glutathione S-transferase family protein, partial [Salmonella sp. s55004]|uniref:glutathione S-transferase family protein n=1 Tax=Salmonella sp. s55004 TaxID=3159675 RepID=UPI00397EDFDD
FSTMPKYILTYFPIPGRGEPIRLTLAVGGADWEDKFVQMEQWPTVKAGIANQKPFRFPWLPHLEVEGENIVVSQSLPALRFVARRFGLDGETDAEKVYVDSILELSADILKAYATLFFSKDPENDADAAVKKVVEYAAFVEVILGDNGSGYLVGKKLT